MAPFADAAVEVTGIPSVIDEGLQLLGNAGRYPVMGNIIPRKEVTIDSGRTVRKSVAVTTMMRYEPCYLREALDFLSTYGDRYPFGELIDAQYPLSDVQQELQDSADGTVTRATLVTE